MDQYLAEKIKNSLRSIDIGKDGNNFENVSRLLVIKPDDQPNRFLIIAETRLGKVYRYRNCEISIGHAVLSTFRMGEVTGNLTLSAKYESYVQVDPKTFQDLPS